MKFKFDANQDFQLDAVNAVVDIFEGQQKLTADKAVTDGLLGIYPNYLSLSREEMFRNVQTIQERNKIRNGALRQAQGDNVADDYDFSIEMETGTGKTYVYLRTIFEINKRYGWKKFIILVPSVAIREGVIKSLKITREHFCTLYDNVPYRFCEYQSKNISRVKHFADSCNINIMVMTVGSFNKDANVLYMERDQMQGEKPMSYIQKTNPILILDEPQNMEGEATRVALKNFNSLVRLRYSATHRNVYNLMYQLTPAEAYQKGLVKKIEVYSVTDDDTGVSRPYLNLVSVTPGKILKASVETVVKDDKGNFKKKKITLTQRDDLQQKTNNPAYAGFVIERMDADAPDYGSTGKIRFQNGVEITQGENIGGNHEQIMRQQLDQTIRLHFEKRKKFREMSIKVLSLFFIDKVDNYAKEDGFIRTSFIELFDRLKVEYDYSDLNVDRVHKGYFAQDRKTGTFKDSRDTRETQDDISAYELIMKDKERLLSFDEPTEFIFSHSALKEGWDNPNVFNICTLRETVAPMRKRQEIGRGMRLCVNQEGERIFLKHINLLSVVANESYAEYVAQLQGEFVEDGIYAPPLPHNARRRKTVKLKRGFERDEYFASLWERISKKTKYAVRVDTETLIERCAARIHELHLTAPQIRIERAGVDIAQGGVSARVIGTHEESLKQSRRLVDCVDFIKNETKLTRQTIATILVEANDVTTFLNNPERFCFETVKIIKEELMKDYIEQISYELVRDAYVVGEFKDIEAYKDACIPVNKSIYDAIVYDSETVERPFALSLDSDERIKLFIKLPNWYKVATPVGDYNPDWAIVTTKRDLYGNDTSERVYFVIETKGNVTNLRPKEQAKLKSAKKHFEVIEVRYKEVERYDEFVNTW